MRSIEIAVTRLTDRVLEEAVDWFDHATRDAIRRWRAPTPLDAFWKVTSASTAARALRLLPRGDFSGEPAKLEASLYRAQLRLWQHAHVHGQPIHVGFIVRDTDHEPRKEGARQAVESGRWPFRVVLAFPHPEAEAWPIAVFEPAAEDERARLAEQTRRLGYSPVEQPERLTSTVSGKVTDAKTVRAELIDASREHDWLEIDLDVLRRRGETTGLTDFLAEVASVVVPLLVGEVRGGQLHHP